MTDGLSGLPKLVSLDPSGNYSVAYLCVFLCMLCLVLGFTLLEAGGFFGLVLLIMAFTSEIELKSF